MKRANRMMIGSGTPSSQSSAPLPNPMIVSSLVANLNQPASFSEKFRRHRIIKRMMRLTGTPSNQSKIGMMVSC
jgi:hypothetical protein